MKGLCERGNLAGLGPRSVAMGGALTGEHWQDVARQHRTRLLFALEAHERDA